MAATQHQKSVKKNTALVNKHSKAYFKILPLITKKLNMNKPKQGERPNTNITQRDTPLTAEQQKTKKQKNTSMYYATIHVIFTVHTVVIHFYFVLAQNKAFSPE